MVRSISLVTSSKSSVSNLSGKEFIESENTPRKKSIHTVEDFPMGSKYEWETEDGINQTSARICTNLDAIHSEYEKSRK